MSNSKKIADKLRKKILKNSLNNKSLKQEAESVFNKLCKEWTKCNVSNGKFVFIPAGCILNGKTMHESMVCTFKETIELKGRNVVAAKITKIGTCRSIDNLLEYLYEKGFEYDITGEIRSNDFTNEDEMIPFIVTIS